VLTAAAAGCGIPGDEGPRAIDKEQIPDSGDVAEGGGSDGRTVLADLYFTSSDDGFRLVVVQREVPTGGSSPAPTPSTVLENLLAGKQDDDQPAGGDHADITTLIPPQTQLASPPLLAGGILTIDLNSAINGVQGEGARVAYGQLVCTADALDEVQGVRFTIDGEPVNAPTAGENSSEPLTCESYAPLVEEAPE
jgi:spore germination protein GerM